VVKKGRGSGRPPPVLLEIYRLGRAPIHLWLIRLLRAKDYWPPTLQKKTQSLGCALLYVEGPSGPVVSDLDPTSPQAPPYPYQNSLSTSFNECQVIHLRPLLVWSSGPVGVSLFLLVV
jgi:hypothetical protein